MLEPISPMQKLMSLHGLRADINKHIQKFWNGIIDETDRLILDRDEQISIMNFIIAKAEVKDIIS